MTDQIRHKKEKEFHDQLVESEGKAREKAVKFYSIQQDARVRYRALLIENCKGKTVLEYGCGPGSSASRCANNGAMVTGIDISPASIEIAKKENEHDNGITYHVMNAEETTFKDNAFDMIVGTSIIHHLDMKKSYSELKRLLNPSGRAIFLEPMGHNPIVNLYRYFTPNMRTDDEHPLKRRDLKQLSRYFHSVEIHYYACLALLAVPFRRFFFFNGLCRLLQHMDQLLFKLPGLKYLAWIVVINVSNPKK
jgi:ubiquinone/menaquinone biosynthesis C-methylase UbiE